MRWWYDVGTIDVFQAQAVGQRYILFSLALLLLGRGKLVLLRSHCLDEFAALLSKVLCPFFNATPLGLVAKGKK